MKRASLIRFRIDFASHCNVGPGKIELLEEIGKSGSLSQAARRMGISYRRAWMLLDSLNNSFSQPTTINKTGGVGGGGAELTPFGLRLVERYREAEQKLNEVAGEFLGEIARHVNHDGAAPTPKVRLSAKRLR
jgi:molybdate transport system regulatory protein